MPHLTEGNSKAPKGKVDGRAGERAQVAGERICFQTVSSIPVPELGVITVAFS